MVSSIVKLTDDILNLVRARPGLTDREITDALRGSSAAQQPINQACRNLGARGTISRRHRPDGRIGNYPLDPMTVQPSNLREPVRHQPERRSDSVSVDDLARWRRQLLRVLDKLDGRSAPGVGPAARVARMRGTSRLPRRVAALMMVVLEARNAAEYEEQVLTRAEGEAVRNAWSAILEWATTQGFNV